MIDPPWVKPAVPVLRLADATPPDFLRDLMRDLDRALLASGAGMRPLTVPRLRGTVPRTPYGVRNLK